MLRIGQLAEQCGVSVETLRFYEKEGLLSEPPRSANGYRLYNSEAQATVGFIIKAKSLGFSLKDIAELISLKSTKEQHTCGEIKAIAENKLQTIEEKIQQLNQLHQALQAISDSCAGGEQPASECTILEALETHDR